ncbi:hypothetical protein FAZ19_02470 [Sphingobacterium alkalisoli]|uniref:Uncharacterized protein n=2 Tax=Sphingobacterium TaxID=28453 RepID=A0A4U0P464_9SPHI|nr:MULTISPECIES: hypothetical protein [Sphingobacterium]TJY68144.1 hypothetical protein FAZ19_02470 [Sphingobacterium alkalisoli]TJZ61980.1 hypothetical protein FAZ15_05565 [Sphingobacterium olei]
MESLKSYITAIVAVAVILGFSAFKVAEKFTQPQSGWYQISVNPSAPDDKSQQIIGGFESETAPNEENCNLESEETPPCQVHLNLTNFSGAATPAGLSVSDATNPSTYNGALDMSQSSDGYARQEEE